jgi:peroxiredoxin
MKYLIHFFCFNKTTWIQLFFICTFILPNLSCQKRQFHTGDEAPQLVPVSWLQSEPLSLKDLKGKVVLIRWWTDECMYCVQSADALNEWNSKFKDSGLVVIGMYHPKPVPRICKPDEVLDYIVEKNFSFPIAIDDQWKNLKQFWLNGNNSGFTSVSFLIDRQGIIRYIHPGGEYHKEMEEGHEPCVRAYNEIQALILKYISQ